MTDKMAPNIIDFFSGRPLSEIKQEKVIRISPEYDDLSMLYSNENNPDRYFAMKVLFWGLRLNGDVVGFVPWLDSVVACPDIIDPLNGQFEGYYDAAVDNIFYDAPLHKILELETSHAYFESHFTGTGATAENNPEEKVLLQELTDNIGTHALLIGDNQKTLTLTEVISWRLYDSGEIVGTLIEPDEVHYTPVIAGDECLYDASKNPQFKFYFQHHIANQIKDDNPEALDAIALLLEEDRESPEIDTEEIPEKESLLTHEDAINNDDNKSDLNEQREKTTPNAELALTPGDKKDES